MLRGFSFAFVVGIIVGTYSSIFIATPIVVLANRMIARPEEGLRCRNGSADERPGAG